MRSAQQTYIQKLGFCDKDRANPRHQLACEFLLHRLWERINHANASKYQGEGYGLEYEIGPGCAKPLAPFPASDYTNVPIRNRYSVSGFADVLVSFEPYRYLGEVKITPERADAVLQQVNFYRSFLGERTKVVILVDYDAPELKRLCAGSGMEVYRLGPAFEAWCATQIRTTVEELV